jgi:hypothetical protein
MRTYTHQDFDVRRLNLIEVIDVEYALRNLRCRRHYFCSFLRSWLLWNVLSHAVILNAIAISNQTTTETRLQFPFFRAFCRIADSSSINAVNFSSARTTKRFPSPRCASTIQIVRPSQSRADTQPQLHPAFGKSNQITDATRAVVALNRGWCPRESTVFGH